jgi:hypothetical protein
MQVSVGGSPLLFAKGKDTRTAYNIADTLLQPEASYPLGSLQALQSSKKSHGAKELLLQLQQDLKEA